MAAVVVFDLGAGALETLLLVVVVVVAILAWLGKEEGGRTREGYG